jgi:hypothetical protein
MIDMNVIFSIKDIKYTRRRMNRRMTSKLIKEITVIDRSYASTNKQKLPDKRPGLK